MSLEKRLSCVSVTLKCDSYFNAAFSLTLKSLRLIYVLYSFKYGTDG